MTWNPEQYLKFAEPRLRPAVDLLARIDELTSTCCTWKARQSASTLSCTRTTDAKKFWCAVTHPDCRNYSGCAVARKASFTATPRANRLTRRLLRTAMRTRKNVDIWQCTYLHVREGVDPIEERTKGTWLKQFLGALGSRSAAVFEPDHAARVRVA